MLKRIFDPSSGAIGTRLKIARIKLIKTIVLRIVLKAGERRVLGRNLIVKPKIKARQIFESGPAIATIASPHR